MGLDRVDAKNIVPSTTQIPGSGFTIQHNNAPEVLVSLAGFFETITSNGTTAIADGVKAGQKLVIRLVDISMDCSVVIQDSANTNLQGDWKGAIVGQWLFVIWDGSNWIEHARDIGYMTNTLGLAALAVGSGNTVSGQASLAVGQSNTADGGSSLAVGLLNEASEIGTVAMGRDALADQKYELAHAGEKFTSVGDAEYRRFKIRRAVTPDAGGDVIGIDATAAGPIIPADTVWNFRAHIVGCSVDAGSVGAWSVEGCIKRVGNTTTICTVQAVNVIHADDADVVITVAVSDANDSLNITVTDATAGGVAYRFSGTIKVEQITFT